MFKSPSWFSAYIKHFVFGWFSATPIKFLDLAGGLAVNCSYFFTICNEEAPIYWKLGRGGPILMAFWERRHHFIGQIWEEAGEIFFSFMSKTILAVGRSSILRSMLCMVSWSFGSSYCISVALFSTLTSCSTFLQFLNVHGLILCAQFVIRTSFILSNLFLFMS